MQGDPLRIDDLRGASRPLVHDKYGYLLHKYDVSVRPECSHAGSLFSLHLEVADAILMGQGGDDHVNFIRTKLFFSLIGASLLAAGVTTVAVAAEHQSKAPSCYGGCPTETTLRLSTHLVIDGREGREVFTVTVSPEGSVGKFPKGTVDVVAGKRVLCTIKLFRGTGSCSLSSTELPPRRKPYLISADYLGKGTFHSSKSRKEFLLVLS